MKPLRHLVPALLLVATAAHAVVIRHGVPDAGYLVPDDALPALADLPMEGQGILIARRWVVTAGHAVAMMRTMPQQDYVTIAGRRRKVSRIVLYPGYLQSAAAWDRLVKNMKSEDARAWMSEYAAFRTSMHDIALLELARPVDDVKPVALYRSRDERGRIAEIFGKGATGDSLEGVPANAPHRTRLRRAYNRIVAAKGQWLYYAFDCGGAALPLEGAIGGGDSGGPLLLRDGGVWKLAGLAQGLEGKMTDLLAMRAGKFRMGICGQVFSNSRVSYYVPWIERVMQARKPSTRRSS